MRSLFICLFILLSCSQSQKNVSWESFYHWTYPRWIGTYALSEVSPYYAKGEIIQGPKETWQTLFAVNFYAKKVNKQVKDCVYFYHSTPSLLKVVENVETTCLQAAVEAGRSVQVSQLSYKFHLQKLVLRNAEMKLDYHFYNMKAAQQFELFQSNLGNKNESGLLIRSAIDTQGSDHVKKLKEGDTCQQLGSNCELVQNQCDYCPNGFHQIIDSNCPRQGTRKCGLKNCGQRGELACPRGRKFSGYTGDYCIADSPLGICDKGLRVHCMDKQLICL